MSRAGQISELLAAWAPPVSGARVWHTRAAALARVRNCCRRDHFEPGHFTASGFVMCPRGEQLLLIMHTKLERWLQPGGHIEDDDLDIIAAARREVEEETGLRAFDLAHPGLYDLDIHEIPARGNEPAHEHFDLRFLFQATRVEVHAGDGVNAATWLPLTQAASLEDESVARVACRLIG